MKETAAHNRPLLEIRDAVVRYHKKEILLGASLDVYEGEIVALIGANGAGKSTLLKSLAGLVPADSGQFLFDGRDINGQDPSRLVRLGIGNLLQGGPVFPRLTVIEHLQLAMEGAGIVRQKERLERAWAVFPTLYPLRRKCAGLLSGGERQLLGLCALFSQNARLWLLDEPSGGLAPPTVKAVMSLVKRISAEERLTVLIAEQNLRGALGIANRVCVLKHGRTFIYECPQEILEDRNLETILFN